MNSNEIILPCRLSYANIWEARQSMEGDKMQYSCCLLIPKTDTATIQRLQKLMTKIESEAVTTSGAARSLPATHTPCSAMATPTQPRAAIPTTQAATSSTPRPTPTTRPRSSMPAATRS